MSKIIKIENCGDCPLKETAGIYYRCPKLMDYRSSEDRETIKDLDKILPNCPLEDA